MKRTTAFIDIPRYEPPKRAVDERLRDWREVEGDLSPAALGEQAARCMDCGLPFCHKGCPLGNYIPDWNDLVYRENWREAIERLHATNNFPEFTGRTCPAPCEEACVLNLHGEPVTIKQIEKQIVDRAWAEGWVVPQVPAVSTGKRVAVVGSGPAGLAAAQQLARVGHEVCVLERDDRLGGLLRYGIPDFKLEKWTIDRRIEQMAAEGIKFATGIDVGATVSLSEVRERFDACVLAIGAQHPRALTVPGHDLPGIHYAMDYLAQQNKLVAGDHLANPISAAGKRVVILGGGDTGADCLGTAHRQGAREVHHFHYKPAPPSERTVDMPWPWWPMILRETSSHEEGGQREWSVITKAFSGAERVAKMHCVKVDWEATEAGRLSMKEVPGTEFDLDVDLVLLAIGFDGPEADAIATPELSTGGDGTLPTDADFHTPLPGVFACGDATRGASLVVWAIWEGRETARQVDIYLTGSSSLPTLPNRHPI